MQVQIKAAKFVQTMYDAVYRAKVDLISMFRFEVMRIFILTWLPINKQSLISTGSLLLIGYYNL